MELQEHVAKIQTRDDLGLFIHHLIQDLRTCPTRWENASLETYLMALAAWIQDMDGYYDNRSEMAPLQPTWKHIGEILLAASIYE